MPIPSDWTAADRIRKAREARGWSQEKLCEETGLNKNTLSAMEPKATSPAPDLSKTRETTWRALASALDVPLPWLRDGVRPD